MPFVALSIAGSDPGGGAGIQADLKTFHRFDVYGTAVVTLVTVQNTVRLSRSVTLDAALVLEQIEAVLEDLPPRAIKTGALGSCAIVKAVAGVSYPGPLIVDPVTFSSTGSPLLDAEGQRAVRDLLLPRASLVTPNVPEAAQLSGIEIHTVDDMREAARRIAALGPAAVLVKGGHLESADAIDVLFSHSEPSHAWNRLHLFGGHYGPAGSGNSTRRRRRTGQGVYYRGHPNGARAGFRRRAPESLGLNHWP
jgi:hydroxymethylpyrimidine/phosphomethylpyrimidine kinase